MFLKFLTFCNAKSIIVFVGGGELEKNGKTKRG
nr:MAG TPA: hypothetical protein [Caudoviricetes sp.]